MRPTIVAVLLAAGCVPVNPPSTSAPSSVAQLPAPALPTDPIDVAITVDDLPRNGPDIPGVTRLSIHERMLATFAKHKTPPVYGFVNAERLEAHPQDRAALTAWRDAGFPLGNHGYSHANLEEVTLSAYLADIDKNEVTLKEVMGDGAAATRAWKVFRYPYLNEGADLASRAVIRAELQKRGYRIAPVTVDFSDWAYIPAFARCMEKGDDKAITALKESYIDEAAWALRWSDGAARELLGRPIEQILLLHVGQFSALMLDELLTVYEKAGVRFVSLDEALADPIYAHEPRAPKAHSGDLLGQIRTARGTRSPARSPSPAELLEVVCK